MLYGCETIIRKKTPEHKVLCIILSKVCSNLSSALNRKASAIAPISCLLYSVCVWVCRCENTLVKYLKVYRAYIVAHRMDFNEF